MSHQSHRDHIEAREAKRWREVVEDDAAESLEALLAADQQRLKEQPPYMENEAREA